MAAGKSSDYGRLFFQAEVFRTGRLAKPRQRPAETVTEPARRVPVFCDCDVLVAGGGPSGTAAAIAAARAGADVVLVERHNHLGGLSTGGLVIWIDRMTGWSGEPVIRGIGEELLERLPKEVVAGPPRAAWGSADAATAAYWKERTAAFHGIVTRSPTIDPEPETLEPGDGTGRRRASGTARLGGGADHRVGWLGWRRRVREQGGTAGDPLQSDDRLHWRWRPVPPRWRFE